MNSFHLSAPYLGIRRHTVDFEKLSISDDGDHDNKKNKNTAATTSIEIHDSKKSLKHNYCSVCDDDDESSVDESE